MKKLLPLSCLLAIALIFSACDSEKETEEIIPEAQAEMSRSFSYSYQEPQSFLLETYGAGSTEAYASDDGEHFSAAFGVPYHVGNDNISFIVRKQHLKNGYIGTYTLQSLPNPQVGEAYVSYSFRRAYNAFTHIFSDGNTINGTFEITSYDEKRKLISGKYKIYLEKAFDPTVDNMHLTDVKRCDITVEGSFTNVRITE